MGGGNQHGDKGSDHSIIAFLKLVRKDGCLRYKGKSLKAL